MPIEDYALIGDTHTAALVGRDGSIDWLCLPRFDSGACFAALLGDASHGRWRIAPEHPVRTIRRRYRPDTLILETDFETDEGVVRLIDCMTPRQDEPDVVRVVQGIRGVVRMKMELMIRFDYGRVVPWVRRIAGHLQAIAGPDSVALWTDVPVVGKDLTTQATFEVRENQHVPFVLMWHPSHVSSPPRLDALAAIEDTARWWREWVSKCRYVGEWREQVVRSLITLKALTYAPTGGMVAAPTTSLPEAVGGVRNWDYRYCWLRDATYSLYAFMIGGFTEEAAAWRNWLLRAVAGDPSTLQTMYGLNGERRLPEFELPWLPGYEHSRPVRIGNAAVDQLQLDVYGEVMDTLHLGRRAGIDSDSDVWALQQSLLRYLDAAWKQPDEGIWEVRAPRRQFTHSKVMVWVAYDRAVKAVERFSLEGPVDHWRAVRDEVHEQVCREAFHPTRNTFTQYYGSQDTDASLLLMPLVGFIPPTDPRMVGTVKAIEEDLLRDGFIARYRPLPHVDGLPPAEGVFLACSFWLADNYALQGRAHDARQLFQRLIALCNDVGLLSEEYDPGTQRLLGNFPQAFSHVMLINTARNLVGRHGPAEQRKDPEATT